MQQGHFFRHRQRQLSISLGKNLLQNADLEEPMGRWHAKRSWREDNYSACGMGMWAQRALSAG